MGVVVVTGATGRIGTAVLPLLPEVWQVKATDLTAAGGVAPLDVTDRKACASVIVGHFS